MCARQVNFYRLVGENGWKLHIETALLFCPRTVYFSDPPKASVSVFFWLVLLDTFLIVIIEYQYQHEAKWMWVTDEPDVPTCSDNTLNKTNQFKQ
jgi:hypothetical protein